MTYNLKDAERANTWSHAASLIVFGLLAIFLIRRGMTHHSITLNFSLILFVIAEALMFFSSTMYHFFYNPKIKRILRYFDHSCIYISIAGSYTPILLYTIGGTLGKVCFLIIWLLAISGITYKIFFLGKYPRFSLFLYLAMGWLVLFIIKPVFEQLPYPSLIALGCEGLLFTLGTYFFWKDDEHTYNHAVWHLFVFLGALAHYFVLWFLL